MGRPHELAPNIATILDAASEWAGKVEEESFSQAMWAMLTQGDIESPIEQALYIGLMTVAKVNFLCESEPFDSTNWTAGLQILPQLMIGKYRADFKVAWLRGGDKSGGATVHRQVVVECDGTAFHERTEPERRYEKARDRYMQKLDLKVFRYTGREILDDPYKIAVEIIEYILGDGYEALTPEQYFE